MEQGKRTETPLRSGKWRGIFITLDATYVVVEINFTFNSDGSLTGSFTTANPLQNQKWDGPPRGEISEGGYSPFGSISFEEEQDKEKYGEARFDGRYEISQNPDSPYVGVIWGSVLVKKQVGNKMQEERGTLTLTYAEKQVTKTDDSIGPWGE